MLVVNFNIHFTYRYHLPDHLLFYTICIQQIRVFDSHHAPICQSTSNTVKYNLTLQNYTLIFNFITNLQTHVYTFDISENKLNKRIYWESMLMERRKQNQEIFAYHVVAATILFNRSITLGVGAASCIPHEIECCFVIVILLPFCIQITRDRIVTFISTIETATVAALAFAILAIAMQQTIITNGQCAPWCRTPP